MKEEFKSPHSETDSLPEKIEDLTPDPSPSLDVNPIRALTVLVRKGYTEIVDFTILEDRLDHTVEVRVKLHFKEK